MSLINAFIAGVTGIDAQSQKMGAISDNIANANTVGYKPSVVLFKTLVTRTDAPTVQGATGPIPFNFAPGGVIPTPEQRMDLQGLLASSSSSTDLGILGHGFFPVTNGVDTTTGAVATGANLAVTRAGSFHLDKDGFMVNSNGFFLMGATSGSTLPSALSGLTPLKFDPGPAVTIAGVATTQVALAGNLPATDAIGTTETMTTGLFDSLGNAFALQLTFTKTALQTWSVVPTTVTAADNSGVTGTISGSTATLSFDTTGQLTSPTSSTSLGTITLSNGQSLSPTFNFAGSGAITAVTQLDGVFAQTGAQQDGKASGSRTGFVVTPDGTMSEVYSNGLVLAKYQIPLVTFPNDQGLEPITGNAWLPTGSAGSGTLAINAADTGGAGQITPSSLEQSSVDLANEFAEMIVTQATYTANTKIITTANEMYQTLTQLR
ncbi:MAG: flagellar hook protein FlgE [Proteobacteria bacterium]|nr:flagellar hook protein FlgE [Pseudomonadota bacterium]